MHGAKQPDASIRYLRRCSQPRACRGSLSLTLADIVVGVAAFLRGELLLSRVFYWLDLCDRPY